MKVDLFEAVKEKALAEGSLYRGNKHDKQRLTDFLEMNGWFGCSESIAPRIVCWLRKQMSLRNWVISICG